MMLRLSSYRSIPKIHNITEKVSPEQLALLVKKEWQLSYVTPLYQFRHTQLKSYSQQLSAFIAAEKQQGLAVEVEGSNGNFKASFSVVESWFKQTFDCCFGPLEISQTSLQWLVALWSNCHAESAIQYLKMIWSLPVVPPLTITYTVDGPAAWELWSSVRKDPQEESNGEEEENSIDIEEVMRFMQGLKGHFYRHFRLDLSAGSLDQVSTALGSAKCSGKMKISNSKYMITTLTLLTECALLKMPI